MSSKLSLRRRASSAFWAARFRLGERSWSQEGEDRILWRYFDGKRSGVYVDIGAHHPFRYSNTNLFYRAGWSGINVDAAPNSMQPFRKHRKRDVNLEVGVSENVGTAEFFIFDEPVLNTFDAALAKAYEKEGKYKILSVTKVPLMPLAEILNKYCAADCSIDFLTIDVEGHDINVLVSNDWNKFRPKVVLAESLNFTIDNVGSDKCASFLRGVGYDIYAKTVNTIFYVDTAS